MEREAKNVIIGAVVVIGSAFGLLTCMTLDEQKDKPKEPVQPQVDEDPLVAPVQSVDESEPQFFDYEIKKGDTLSELSERFYKNWVLYPEIARANGIKDPNKIFAGSTIRVPKYIRHKNVVIKGNN